MTGSSAFHLEPSPDFAVTVAELERHTYGRKDKKGPVEFRERLTEELEKLFNWPHIAGCRREPFPTAIGEEVVKAGWTFHKVEFSTPRANGAARQGRLMFLVHLQERRIVPVCVYTHAQYPGRVPDASLEVLVHAAVRSTSQPMPVIDVPAEIALEGPAIAESSED